jgi:Zn-dependent peptidase ImmA (M78 family)
MNNVIEIARNFRKLARISGVWHGNYPFPVETATTLLTGFKISYAYINRRHHNADSKVSKTQITTSGFLAIAGEKKRIFVDIDAHDFWEYRTRFTIAHELGHYLIGESEQLADWFAAELLMPLAEIKQCGLCTISELSEYFKVTKSAMLCRLKKLKIREKILTIEEVERTDYKKSRKP